MSKPAIILCEEPNPLASKLEEFLSLHFPETGVEIVQYGSYTPVGDKVVFAQDYLKRNVHQGMYFAEHMRVLAQGNDVFVFREGQGFSQLDLSTDPKFLGDGVFVTSLKGVKGVIYQRGGQPEPFLGFTRDLSERAAQNVLRRYFS